MRFGLVECDIPISPIDTKIRAAQEPAKRNASKKKLTLQA